MSSRPPSDPRSPVQGGGSSGAVPILLIAGFVAVLYWGWQNDWTGDALAEEPMALPDASVPPSHPGRLAAAPPAHRAKANLAAYFTDGDYPQSAIRNEEQGRVAFRLFVSPEGRVTDCRIVQGSGSATLDAATCRILATRARFEPARDASGKAVPDEANGRIMWVLPPG